MTAPAGPPRLARWLVEHAVPRDMREDVSGDLIELFHRDRASRGARFAATRYWRQAASCSIRFGAERCRNALGGGRMRLSGFRPEVNRPLRTWAGWRTDAALAVRMVRRHPAMSVIAIFGSTVAIAMAATMFTIIGEQLNPSDLPLPEGDRIVALQKWDAARSQSEPVFPQDVQAWREQISSVRDIGAFRTVTKNLVAPPAAPEPIEIAEMSAAGFEIAATAPVIGRVIRAEDERPGAPPVVVIGYSEWHRRFGSDPGVLQTSVQLGGTHHTVVGVMPEGFAFPVHHAYWIPLRLDTSGRGIGSDASVSVFGRLAHDATLQSAQAELAAVGERTRTRSPSNEGQQDARPRVMSYARQFSAMEHPGNRLALQLARFLVATILVVVSINIAVLVYARTAARQGEIAVRTALGASRGRIVAQLFAEGLVLAGLGAVAGLALTGVALVQIREAFSQSGPLPFWFRLDVSGYMVSYVVGLTLVAAAVIGALPGWHATGRRVQQRLQALAAGGGAGMHLGRTWTALIVLQVAFAVALLPMVVARMSELARDGVAPWGFPAHEYVVAQLAPEQPAVAQTGPIDGASRFVALYREIERRITDSGMVRASTFSSFAAGFEPFIAVRSDIAGQEATVRVNRVAVNFFDTFGVPILTGRAFTSADAAPDARSVIVNRAFTTAVPDSGGVLGSRIRLAVEGGDGEAVSGLSGEWHQIIGIVEDFPMATAGSAAQDARVYRATRPDGMEALTMTLHVHAADAGAWNARLRHIAADVDPTLQVTNVTAVDDLFRQYQRPARLLAAVLAALTASVLLLSAAGIYAMMAFSVTQRRREIGIRLALGAGARSILWTMFSRASAQLLAGAGLGLAIAVLLHRLAEGVLMSGAAAASLAGVMLLMTTAGLLAALGPARQGLRIEPTEALRDPSS